MTLDELKALCAGVPQGQWFLDEKKAGVFVDADLGDPPHQVFADADDEVSLFAIAAHEMLPSLIAVAEAATRFGRCIDAGISVLKGSAYHALLAEALAALEAP